MTEVICEPINVQGTPTGITTVGAGSAWAAVSDAPNDSSYIQLSNINAKVSFGIETPTPPADEKVAAVRWRLRSNKVKVGGAAAYNQHPAIKGTLSGKAGPPLQGRPWDGIGMQTATAISWSEITTTRIAGNFPAIGLPISVSPTAMTLRISRDEQDNDWEPRIYQVEVLVTYVKRPIVTILKPSGAIGTTHPEVRWENTKLERAGGPQTQYHVRIFKEATYTAGGFNPNSSVQDTGSGAVSSPVVSWQSVNDLLMDDDYRTYVRVAQTFNGARWWSNWAWRSFTLGIDRPGTPTFTLTPQDTLGRMKIVADDTAGGEVTEYFQVHRSKQGASGPWNPVTTALGRGFASAAGGSQQIYDFEGLNNQTIWYRVRAVFTDSPDPLVPGQFPTDAGLVFSAWAAVQSGKWQDSRWHFQHPYDDTLNLTRDIRSQPSRTRSARAEVFQPLGRAPEESIAISDTYGAWSGEIIVRNNNDGERAAWDALIGDGLPLLVKAPDFVPDWRDSWMHLSEHSRERIVDNQNFDITWDRIAFQQVGQPVSAGSNNPPADNAANTVDPQTGADTNESQ